MEDYEAKMEKMQSLPNAPPMYSMQQYPQENILKANNLQFSQAPAMEQLRPPISRPHTSRPATASVIMVNPNTPVGVGHEAQRLTCPHCGVVMLTRLDYRATYHTHIVALILCITGLIFCAPLPYFIKSCKSLNHYCSNCDQFIGNAKV